MIPFWARLLHKTGSGTGVHPIGTKLLVRYLRFLLVQGGGGLSPFFQHQALWFQVFRGKVFRFLYQGLRLRQALDGRSVGPSSFYGDRRAHCALVKTYFTFTNLFVTITDLSGRIQHWVSAGTGGFHTRVERSASKVPISLSLRISNLLARKKYRFVKIQHRGPSKKFRAKIYQTLKLRSWSRKYQVVALEEKYSPAFNGCRLKRAPRK